MKLEIQKYYNNLAKEYNQDRFANSYGKYIHSQELAIVNKYLNPKDISSNVDIACGTGRFLPYCQYGVDISKEMLACAQAVYSDRILSFGDAEALPYGDGQFQNALSFHLFMHLDLSTTAAILKEVHRVLQSGAYFIFDIPSAKRRKLTGYKSKDWHGGNQIRVEQLQEMIRGDWELVEYRGIAFFPIHRIPRKLRPFFMGLDNLLSKSFLREYSSHLVFVLKRKC